MLAHLLALLNNEVTHAIARSCKTQASREFVSQLIREGMASSDMNTLCDKPENKSIDDDEFRCAVGAKSLAAIDQCHIAGMAPGDAAQSVDQLEQAIVQACGAADSNP
jgi:hypothetical protein